MRDGVQTCLQEALAHFPLGYEKLSKHFLLPAQKHNSMWPSCCMEKKWTLIKSTPCLHSEVSLSTAKGMNDTLLTHTWFSRANHKGVFHTHWLLQNLQDLSNDLKEILETMYHDIQEPLGFGLHSIFLSSVTSSFLSLCNLSPKIF